MSERAMLSDYDERVDELAYRYETCLGDGALAAGVVAGMAQREARRILAVTEPRTEDADYHAAPTILWPADLPAPTAQLRKRPFHVACILANRAADRHVFVLQPEDARILVESLAAFVGADDPGAYLATVAR